MVVGGRAGMIQPATLLTIGLMALATYLTRALGYMVLGNRALSQRAMAVLNAAPACVLLAVISPHFVSPRPADLLALAITILAATKLPMLATVAVAVTATAALRHLLG
jgi:uncharacterized membrane protein